MLAVDSRLDGLAEGAVSHDCDQHVRPAHPIERLTELEKDCTQAKGDIREILDRLAEKHGASARDVTAAMLSIDDTLSDLLYDQERMLQHEIEDLTPV